jgi:hypothetical protein
MQNTSTTYYGPAAGNYDGSIVQETFNEVLPNELLCVVVEGWGGHETTALSTSWSRAHLPDIGLSNTYMSALR